MNVLTLQSTYGGLLHDTGKAVYRAGGQRGSHSEQGYQFLHGVLPGAGWAPALDWTAQAELAGFDPGYFLPDWPGRVTGSIRSTGQRSAAGDLQADVDIPDIGGSLRGRPLDGRGKLAIQMPAQGNARYQGDVTLALGDSRVRADGRIADTLQVDAEFAPLQRAIAGDRDGPGTPWLAAQLAATSGPVIAATDYVRAVAETVRAFVPEGRKYLTLGTDGFGRSDTRAALRAFFGVDAAAVVRAAKFSMGGAANR